MPASSLTCSDYVFTRNQDGVSGAGIPVNNVLMHTNLAPMCVDNTDTVPQDERVSSLFKGDVGVPLGLLVIGKQQPETITLNQSCQGVAPPHLMEQLVDLLRPRSSTQTRKRRPSTSSTAEERAVANRLVPEYVEKVPHVLNRLQSVAYAYAYGFAYGLPPIHDSTSPC